MKFFDQIAAELQGYDPNALSADAALAFLLQLVEPLTETEPVPLRSALGRVLAADLISPINVPAHDNSAMDGYAFDGTQLQAGQTLRLKVVGTVLAGGPWPGTVKAGECLKIMTGAVLPAGLDSVVPQEFTSPADRPDVICIPAGVLARGENRRLAGEDLRAGSPALLKGERLTPAALGLVASLGLEMVTVLRKPRVAYFSTGDEILSPGQPLHAGAVFDSNRFTVLGLLERLGCSVIDLGLVRDEPALLEATFRSAAAQADAIITSGGVSVGEADHTKAMMKKLAGNSTDGHHQPYGVVFWKIAMRPGRPMAVGRIPKIKLTTGAHADCVGSYLIDSNQMTATAAASTVLFGLPGNPVAVMVTFLAFVRPALLRLMGANAPTQPLLQARSLEAIRKKPGRTEYQRGIVSSAADGTLHVKTTGNQGSGVLSSMVQANGLIVLAHAQGNVAAGDTVSVLMFEGAI